MVLDARTGDEVRLPALEFWGLTRPRRCSDDHPAFCFQIHRSDDDGGTRYRADPVAGTLAPDPSYVADGNVRFLGEHVYSTNDRADEGGTELLGYQADGRTLWEVPYVDVFGPRSSSDSGWSWDDEGAGERIIGIGGAGYYAGIKAGDEIPADALRAVGLDRSTGRVAWSIKGASHCPMDVEARPRVSDHFIACRFTGKEVIVDAGPTASEPTSAAWSASWSRSTGPPAPSRGASRSAPGTSTSTGRSSRTTRRLCCAASGTPRCWWIWPRATRPRPGPTRCSRVGGSAPACR
ncbi:hypothetical protein G7085_05525 [Tessaracoccus sp. HDW20]|uniref:hypothetical protein n=1 Tax=Tessaracoccus coleopterorum TaxID=2714950 RepID=UPI0018D2FEFB|nr:hypothetical protein [Tessaracoccus coleopterorum]NHB84261.1 hypothetical protein [Tessaracoccus coleopterorum]